MRFKLIQDGKVIRDKALKSELKKRSFYAFNQDWMRWEKTSFTRQLRDGKTVSSFVGIVAYKGAFYLSLPKSITITDEKDVFDLFMEYSKLAYLYFTDIRKYKIEGESKYPSCMFTDMNSLDGWYKNSNEYQNDFIVVFAMKFDFVFEWLLSRFFKNQLRIGDNLDVLLKSNLIKSKSTVDLNSLSQNIYQWNAKGTNIKDRKTGKQKKMSLDSYFKLQENRNRSIPDLISEVVHDGEAKVCVMDAKYIGFSNIDENAYLIPGKSDIYKQFFYQEQVKEIYKENKMDVNVYNYFFVPDYKQDANRMANTLFRFAGEISFLYHEKQMIGVIQVNMNGLIHYCTNPNDAFYSEILKARKKKYKDMCELVYDTVLFQKEMKCL